MPELELPLRVDYFEVPTDLWPVFNCPSVAGFDCPPRLLKEQVSAHLSALSRKSREHLRVAFTWDGDNYQTYADILFVTQSGP
jgi:hypothetical protein